MTKNIKGLLVDMIKYPAAVEAMLPAGAPKLSTNLADITNQFPAIPDFPVDIPLPPALPTLPAMPAMPGLPAGLGRQYIRAVEVGSGSNRVEIIQSPATGVLPEVVTRRGM